MAQAIRAHSRSGLRFPRMLILTISTVTGVCFAVLAGLSISAIVAPVRSVHVLSGVIAVVSLAIAFLAFHAAKAGYTDRITLVGSLVRGMLGAFVGMVVIGAFLFLFRPDAQSLLAHSLGRRASAFTNFQLLVGSVLLGFGAGFVARIRTGHRSALPSQ